MTDSTARTGERFAGARETAALFRARNYRLFWFGSVFYYTGLWMDQVVRTALAYDIQESALWLGLVAGAQALMMGLAAMLGGTLADRAPKLRIMRLAQISIVANMFVTSVLLEMDQMTLPILTALSALFGTSIGISLPGRLSFISEITEAATFVRAYAFYYVAFNLLNVVGPALGGVILVVGSPTRAFEFMCLSQAASLWLLLRIKPTRATPPPRDTTFTTDLVSMFRLMRSQRIRLLMLMQALATAFVVSTTQLLPVVVKRVYNHSVGSGLGWVRASFGLGGLVGALALSQLGKTSRKTALLLKLGMVQGVLLAVFASMTSIVLGAIALAVVGSVQAVYLTLTSTLFATSVNDAIRGRVMSLYLMATIVQPIVIIPMGSLADRFGVQPTFVVCGALFVAIALFVAVRFPLFRDAEEADLATPATTGSDSATAAAL